jgi:hypothetical protein
MYQGYFPGIKQPKREADNSPPSIVQVKSVWIFTSTFSGRHNDVMLRRREKFYTIPRNLNSEHNLTSSTSNRITTCTHKTERQEVPSYLAIRCCCERV